MEPWLPPAVHLFDLLSVCRSYCLLRKIVNDLFDVSGNMDDRSSTCFILLEDVSSTCSLHNPPSQANYCLLRLELQQLQKDCHLRLSEDLPAVLVHIFLAGHSIAF